MKPLFLGSLLVSLLIVGTSALAETRESSTAANSLSDLDILSKDGQSAAANGGVAVFMPRGISPMTMTVVGHETPCDFTLFDQARDFARFQMENPIPFNYCVLGRTNLGTSVKVAIAGHSDKPSASEFVVGGQVAGNMAPTYWDESSKMLVLAGFHVTDVAGSIKQAPTGVAAKTLACGVSVAELAGARPNIGIQQGSCANLRVMYYALKRLGQANADLSANKLDKAGAGFAAVHTWLIDNKVESIELMEAKLGEGSVQSARNNHTAAVQSYIEARNLLQRIDPSWHDMRTVIGWRLAKSLAAAKQFEVGMREMSRLNEAPQSCRGKCKDGLIETLERYINWAARQKLPAEGRLLAARKLVLMGEDD